MGAALLLMTTLAASAPADDEGGVGNLATRTCMALDAIGVAASDTGKDPTGPISGPAVWGCYFAAFFSLSFSPIAPGAVTACGTAASGMVGAFMDGRPWWPVLLWSLPGVGVGVLLSLIGVGIVVGTAVFAVAFPGLMTAPVIGVIEPTRSTFASHIPTVPSQPRGGPSIACKCASDSKPGHEVRVLAIDGWLERDVSWIVPRVGVAGASDIAYGFIAGSLAFAGLLSLALALGRNARGEQGGKGQSPTPEPS